jgi:hypothetical protein
MEITKEKYESILAMVQSKDRENWTVAFEILDQVKLNKKNVIPVLLLLKNGLVPDHYLEEAYADFYKRIKRLLNKSNVSSPTFKEMFDVACKKKVPEESMQLYVECFTGEFISKLHLLGYDFIEGMDIKFKLKKNDK